MAQAMGIITLGFLPSVLGMALVGRQSLLVAPLINVDLPLLALVTGALPFAVALALWCTFLLLDLMNRLGVLFHFTFVDLLGEVRNALLFDRAWTLGALLGLAAVAAVAVAAARRAKPSPRGVRISLACLAAIAVADVGNGSSLYWMPVRGAVPVNIAGSSVVMLGRAVVSRIRGGSEPVRPDVPGPSSLLADVRAGNPRATTIVLIVVESLGAIRDSATAAWLEAPLVDAARRSGLQVRRRFRVARGATVSGELRELCGAYGTAADAPGLAPACMPALLREAGWQTIAIHGNTLQFYRRLHWWPAIGFSTVLGREELRRLGEPGRCAAGLFALCDTLVAGEVRRQVAAPLPDGAQGRLVYWLTLDSHLPGSIGREGCAGVPSVAAGQGATCAWLHRLRTAFAEAGRIVESGGGSLRLVVAGDHPPPSLSESLSRLVRRDSVPWIEVSSPTSRSAPAPR